MVASRIRFDTTALRLLAGDKVFARGETYFLKGQVAILAIDNWRVRAQVAGTENYHTEVTGRDFEIAGNCSCPAFEDWGFCKHMVAVALATNALGAEGEGEGAGALARIREYLRQKSVDALAEMIVEFVERDTTLFRKLDMAATTRNADDATVERHLRKAIGERTRANGYIEYRAVPKWAAGVDEVLDLVADLVSSGREVLALGLAEHAVDRIERAMESIDDSDGHCGGLLCRARDIHLGAACAARPEPLSFARTLFTREMKGEYGAFDGASIIYADALGVAGLAEYRRLAAEAWDKLPPKIGRAVGRGSPAVDTETNYDQLMRILDGFAESDGDLDVRVGLRAKHLSSPSDYLQLAQFCLAHGRGDEALRRAEEGLWVFEDDRADQRLAAFTVELLAKAGRHQDAEALLRRTFEKAPSLELYRQLRRIGGVDACERAVEFVQAQIAGKTSSRREFSADLLVRILMHDQSFDSAWAVVRRHSASPGVCETLAQASEATHPGEAIEIYAARVDSLAHTGGTPAYEEVVALLARLAQLRSAAEQAAHIAALKLRFGRKRNLLKLLG